MTFKEIFEAFKDMGKLSDEELKKGQNITKDDIREVPGSVFYKAITGIKANDLARKDKAKGLDTLSVYKRNEYNKMRCYLGDNNSSGYCIKGKDLVSVFSTQGKSGHALVKSAIENGARTLDCFAEYNNGKVSGQLYSLYSAHGFKIDKSLTTGELGVPYTIQNGISRFVDDNEKVHINDPRVVIFMKR